MYVVSVAHVGGSEPHFIGSNFNQALAVYKQLVIDQGTMEKITLIEVPINTPLIDGMMQSPLVTIHKSSRGSDLAKGWRYVIRRMPPE